MKKSYPKSFYIDENSFEELEMFLNAPYENKEKAWVVSNDYPLYGKYEVIYSKERPEGYIYARRSPKLDDLNGDPGNIKDTMTREYLWWFCGKR